MHSALSATHAYNSFSQAFAQEKFHEHFAISTREQKADAHVLMYQSDSDDESERHQPDPTLCTLETNVSPFITEQFFGPSDLSIPVLEVRVDNCVFDTRPHNSPKASHSVQVLLRFKNLVSLPYVILVQS